MAAELKNYRVFNRTDGLNISRLMKGGVDHAITCKIFSVSSGGNLIAIIKYKSAIPTLHFGLL